MNKKYFAFLINYEVGMRGDDFFYRSKIFVVVWLY